MGLLKRQLQSSGLCRLDNCNNSERSSRRFIKTNEAPYQTSGRRTFSATLGFKELNTANFWISALSECLSCYLYVFVVCSTRISWTGTIIGHEPNLVAMALSSGIAMMLLVRTFRSVHVNPALTISFLLTGRIPIIRSIVYTLSHCVGSIAAAAFLYSISVAGHAGALGVDIPHFALETWQILTVEIVISFVVTLVTYATCNYSSYTNARKFVLEQVGQKADFFNTAPSVCDYQPALHTSSNHHLNHQPQTTNVGSNTSRRSMISNQHRIRPHTKSYFADNDPESNSEFEYEYDNHRIYATQQSVQIDKTRPIEEILQEESQLLAPNGFPLELSSGQAFVIGLAYTLASLSGIPASGASLNPARSLGPAFIMNHWDLHWIYWCGPVTGAVAAGFLYEFIFNPTRTSSLCYLHKLFRLSAHDMAKVGTKSRLYQNQQHQRLSPMGAAPAFSSTTEHRLPPMPHHPSTIQHLPHPQTRSMQVASTLSNNIMLNSSRDPQHMLVAPSHTLAHLQSSQVSNNLDLMHYLNHNQPHAHQPLNHQEVMNFERQQTPSGIVNLLASKQQQSTINFPQANGLNFHSNSVSIASGSSVNNTSSDCAKFVTSGFRNFQEHSMNKPTYSEL